MSEEKPSPVTYHEYNIPSLNSLFAWSSALLLATSLWMIWADYEREWKGYQRRFREVEIQRTKAAIAASDKAIDKKKFDAAKAALTSGEQALANKRAEAEKLSAEILVLDGKWYKADRDFKFKKAELDVARYEVDEARHANHALAEKQKAFDEVAAAVETNRLAFEGIDTQKAAAEAELAKIRADVTGASKEIKDLTKEKTRLEGNLAKIDRSLFNDWFRDQPMVDFLAPTIKVNQVVLPAVHTNVNFQTTVPQVDRCHSCHLAADRPGYTEETLDPVFRTHPRQEKLIGRNHPVERFGCTGCHGGSGLSITFTDATHTVSDRLDAKDNVVKPAEQVAHEWTEKHHWHEVEHWDQPMQPLPFTEANCANCHREESRVPFADKLNAGRQIIEDYGCFGCHKIDRPGYGELRKAGPSLANIQGKVGKDWIVKWLRQPKSFRSSTKMPRFWGNSNTAQATATMNFPLRDQVESEAVGRYVLKHSAPYAALPKPIGTGDPGKGKWLVENRGCKACHVVGAGDQGDNRYNPDFGPELNQVGSKLTLDWLYAWIRDPRSLWPDTRMPDLRLTDQEALDAATYLATLKNPEFDASPAADLGSADAAAMVESLTYEYLRKETTTADAKGRMAKMDGDARYEYLGKKLVARYGCFGCHDGIGGFENAQQIGTELTEWASKLITQLDFGLVHLHHSKHDWLRAKLTNPRRFDEGKVDSKEPQDLLKMPNFEFTPAQVELLMTAVLGFQRDYVQPAGHRKLDFAAAKVEKGRRLYRQFNCQGCHAIDSVGGGMEKVLEGGKSYAPPVLVADYKMPDGRTGRTDEGAKVQPDWLFSFLKSPSEIRPWLHVRMPSFGLNDADSTGLVEYFAHSAQATYDKRAIDAAQVATDAAKAGGDAAAQAKAAAKEAKASADAFRAAFPFQSVDRGSVTQALLGDGEALFKEKQCLSCHLPLEHALAAAPKSKPADIVSSLAPNLELAKSRLRYDWLHDWLKDPMMLQKDTKMPSGYFYIWDEEKKAYAANIWDAETKAINTNPANAERQIDSLRAYLHFHAKPIYESTRVAAAKP